MCQEQTCMYSKRNITSHQLTHIKCHSCPHFISTLTRINPIKVKHSPNPAEQNDNPVEEYCTYWRGLSSELPDVSKYKLTFSLGQRKYWQSNSQGPCCIAWRQSNCPATQFERGKLWFWFQRSQNWFLRSWSGVRLKGSRCCNFSCGRHWVVDQKKFIDASIRAGVKRFIPSEFSSNTLSDTIIQLVPLFEQKRVVLDYLKSKESEGLTWTGIATSLLFDWVRVRCNYLVDMLFW
jgi:hypothetical protein